MAYELLWEPDGVVKRFTGVVTGHEFINAVERSQGDARFDDARYVINDLSAVTRHDISEDVLTETGMLQYGAHASNPNCRVVYVTADVALKSLVENAPSINQIDSYQTVVCSTLNDAREWLDSQPQLHMLSNVMGFRIG